MADTPPAAEMKGGVIPYLMVDGVVQAVELYQKAFGATLAGMMPPDEKGRTMHAHLYINGASVMFGDPFPEHGQPAVAPAAFNLMMRVDDVEAWFKRAVDAGLEVVMPLADQFWGDRYGMLKDPYGVRWALSAPISN